MDKVTPESLTQGAVKLFSLPDIYFQINEMIADPRFSAEDIGQVILKDPALSARLLKIVNSSYYGFKARIDTIGRAITIVGVEDLQNLILATSIVDTFSSIPCELVDMTSFWMRSINCGVIASLLAKKSSVLHCDRLFLTGLLHDIGSLIMYHQLPEQSMQVLLAADNNRCLVSGLEQEIIGFTYADVGGELIIAWNLPESLSEAVKFHLQPEMASQHKLDAHLVFLASRLCDMATLNDSLSQVLAEIPDTTMSLIRLDETEILQVLEKATDDFAQVYDLIVPNKKFP